MSSKNWWRRYNILDVIVFDDAPSFRLEQGLLKWVIEHFRLLEIFLFKWQIFLFNRECLKFLNYALAR